MVEFFEPRSPEFVVVKAFDSEIGKKHKSILYVISALSFEQLPYYYELTGYYLDLKEFGLNFVKSFVGTYCIRDCNVHIIMYYIGLLVVL